MSADDAMDRVRRALGSTGGPAGAGGPPKGRQIAPVPDDAPAPAAAFGKLGKPSRTWAYRDAQGRLIGYVLRFETPEGKTIRPLSWRDSGGGARWTLQSFDDSRPLYGLDALAARPSEPVLIVEGEKAADAARGRFPAFVVVTWPGGSKAVGKADFAPLAGRRVAIWPDADAAGLDAAGAVERAAGKAGAACVAIVRLPPGLPAGWDLADDWPSALGQAEAVALIEAALTGARPADPPAPRPEPDPEADASGVAWPPGFHMDPASGLWWTDRANGKVSEQRVSDPFEVLGEARDSTGRAWSVVVRVKARDGRVTDVVLSRGALANGGGDARRELADAGLRIATGQGIRDRLTQALMMVGGPSGFIELTEATGWHGGRFVLPGRTIGPPGGDEVLYTGDASALKYGQRGDFASWRKEVAAKAVGNPLLMFALSMAFAAPLLKLLEAEGGGFHIRGSSSSGKSTLLVAAGSVWGGDPNGAQHGFGHTWRATTNALETLAMAHNDSLLCLDELAQVDPREAGVAAYALANGDGKKRLRADATLRQAARWRLILLSTGEIGLADHVASDGKGGRVAAGQELRLIDVSADMGAALGIWNQLDKGETGAARSEAIKAAAKAHFGHAGPLFLEKLIANREALLKEAEKFRKVFRQEARQAGDSGQIDRAIERFALIAAAGELAAQLKIVPWQWSAATLAVLAIFQRWAQDFGRGGLREEAQIIERVTAFIQIRGSEFVAADRNDEEKSEADQHSEAPRARSMRTSGVRHRHDGRLYYLFYPSAFKDAVQGFDAKEAARLLKRREYLLTDGEQGRLTRKKKHDGQAVNFYWVSARILGDADG